MIDHPISNYLESYSTKMFEYMACGVPVVCSDFPLWERLIADADCGVHGGPDGPDRRGQGGPGRSAAIPTEARRLGENGRPAILERYNWENEFAKLDALYRRLA